MLAGLAGCAAPPPKAGAVAPAPEPVQTIDGQYRGVARLVVAKRAGCPHSGNRTVTVAGNALSLNYWGARAAYALPATVAPDGSIHASDGRGSIDGQISSGHMDLTVASDYCEMRYALNKS